MQSTIHISPLLASLIHVRTSVYPWSVITTIVVSLPVFWTSLCTSGWRCLTEILYVASSWIVTDQAPFLFSLTYFWLNYAPWWMVSIIMLIGNYKLLALYTQNACWQSILLPSPSIFATLEILTSFLPNQVTQELFIRVQQTLFLLL
jgi:hypothetical protein